jgi:Arc/MetJ-type ribon-helix-helix transcriptional regulator
MLALSLPEALDARLDDLVRSTGKSKAVLVEEAIVAHIEDLEYAAREKASLETWLRTDGVDAYDRMQADPGRALSVEQVKARLRARREGSGHR